MRYPALIFLLAAIICVPNVEAKRIRYSVGGILFDPTGFWGSYRLQNNREIDMALALDSKLHIQGTMLYTQKPIEIELVPVPWYYGFGARVKTKGDVLSIGPRGVVGLKYRLNNTKVVFFGETSVVIDLLGDTGFHLGLAIGARYYF